MAERIDDLNRNGLKLIQDTNDFRFGTDTVLLTGFVNIKKYETTLDLGCGTGAIPVLLCGKTEGKYFEGLEINERTADMARRSVEMNGLTDRINIRTGDIKDIQSIYAASSFDVVLANPPYARRNGCIGNEKTRIDGNIKNIEDARHDSRSAGNDVARRETLLTFDDVAAAAAWALRFGGRFCLVHKPARLVEIINTLSAHMLELKTLRFVQAYAGAKPKLALMEATLGGRPRLTVLPPLIIYRERGIYTEEADAIYNG